MIQLLSITYIKRAKNKIREWREISLSGYLETRKENFSGTKTLTQNRVRHKTQRNFSAWERDSNFIYFLPKKKNDLIFSHPGRKGIASSPSSSSFYILLRCEENKYKRFFIINNRVDDREGNDCVFGFKSIYL